jgi:hypothetical protein
MTRFRSFRGTPFGGVFLRFSFPGFPFLRTPLPEGQETWTVYKAGILFAVVFFFMILVVGALHMKPLDQMTLSVVSHKESALDFECALCWALSSDNEEVRKGHRILEREGREKEILGFGLRFLLSSRGGFFLVRVRIYGSGASRDDSARGWRKEAERKVPWLAVAAIKRRLCPFSVPVRLAWRGETLQNNPYGQKNTFARMRFTRFGRVPFAIPTATASGTLTALPRNSIISPI